MRAAPVNTPSSSSYIPSEEPAPAVQTSTHSPINTETSHKPSSVSSAAAFFAAFKIPSMTLPKKIPNQERPHLVFETIEPSRFRTTSDLNGVENCNLTGLSELNISGSEQFSEKMFDEILNTVNPKKIVVFDTRQESHGFIDGKPVSWFAADNHNWANVEKPAQKIPEKEHKKLDKLKTKFSQMAIPHGEDLKRKIVPPRTMKVMNLPESKLETEEQMVTGKGGRYVRIPISDHVRPSDETVDAFIVALRSLRDDDEKHLHFHCRGGMGRTTTMMIMYDMLCNASKVSCEDIIDRQIKLRKRSETATTIPGKEYKQIFREEKAELLDVFYQYAKENPLDHEGAILWAEWLKQKSNGAQSEVMSAHNLGGKPKMDQFQKL